MRKRVFILGISLLSVLLLSACEGFEAGVDSRATKVAAEIFATQTAQAPTATPTPTMTLTPTPTLTPTSTPTPTPTYTPSPTATPSPTSTPTSEPASRSTPVADLSGVTLTLEDLPEGFEELPSEALSAMKEELSQDESVSFQNVFAFMEAQNVEIIISLVAELPGRMDQVGFDVFLRNPEMVGTMFAAGMEGQGVTIEEQEELPGVDEIGDSAAGLTMALDTGSIPIYADVVIFRRDVAGVILLVMYFDDEGTSVSAVELAEILDARAQDTTAE